MRELTYEEIPQEPDATVFAAISLEGEEGHLRIKMPDAEDWGDEYASWTFKVYDEQDRCDLAEMLLDPVKAMAAIRAVHQESKRVASMYGDDVEDIDEENALDQQRAMRLGPKYDVYGGLEGMDFNAILQSTMVEDELEKLDGSGASDPGSIMSAG